MIQFSDTKVVSPEPRQALNAVRTLRRSLAGLELSEQVRSEAGRALDEIEDELRIPGPRPRRRHRAPRAVHRAPQ